MFGKLLKNLTTGSEVRPPLEGPSALSTAAALDVLSVAYLHILRRTPDAAARLWMQKRLDLGESGLSVLSDILTTAASSPQQDDRSSEDMEDMEATFAVLTQVHQRFLGRLPDAATEGWLRDRLRQGQSGISLVGDLMLTPEYAEWSRNPLFVPPGHFYSPITAAPEVEAALTAAAAHSALANLPGIDINRDKMLALWNRIGSLPRDADRPGQRYNPDNPNFSAPDAFIWEGMLREVLPHRVIEVGSGWSTALLLDTIEVHFPHRVELTFIEPYPDLLRSRLGDTKDIKIIESGVQCSDLSLFEALQSGDILFIDSTHIVKTGSDVVHELFEVLPRLKSGVYVHFHDVFWPFEYPRAWALEENRSWNELYALRAFLTDNPRWEIVMFNDYLAKTAPDKVRRHYPGFTGLLGGSLYLRKR